MTRILLGLAGVVLLAVTALGLVWLAGQVLLGVGALAVGTAGVLLRLLWFLLVAGVLGGATYFVSNAWRPGLRVATPAPRAPVAPAPAPPQAPLVVSAVPQIVLAPEKPGGADHAES